MDRTVWGYCRVSSVDQNLDRQKAAMLAEGIDEKHILCAPHMESPSRHRYKCSPFAQR